MVDVRSRRHESAWSLNWPHYSHSVKWLKLRVGRSWVRIRVQARELSLVILQYSQFNSFLQTRCCGSMSCCVGMCCRECSWLGVRRMLYNEGLVMGCVGGYPPTQPITSPSLRSIRRTPSQLHSLQHIPTQHDMLPQHLVCKNELNCEYCNITSAKNNKASWWWSDKIETCRSDFKCF